MSPRRQGTVGKERSQEVGQGAGGTRAERGPGAGEEVMAWSLSG